jgi:hypothetical protein
VITVRRPNSPSLHSTMSSYPVTHRETDASESVHLLSEVQSEISVSFQSAEMHPLLTSNDPNCRSNDQLDCSSYSVPSFVDGDTFEILAHPSLPSSSDPAGFVDATVIPSDYRVVHENVLQMAVSKEEPDRTLMVMHTASHTGRRLDNLERDESNSEESRMIASGIAGVVVGSLIFGPFLGTLLGFGAAYSTRKEGAAGDIGRALGDVALITRDRAVEIDRKHFLVQKGKDALARGWEKAKEMDREHHILEKGKDFLIFCWTETVDFTRRHRIIERGVQGVGKALEWLFSRIFRTNTNISDSDAGARTYQYERYANPASNFGDTSNRSHSSSNPSVPIFNAQAL